MVDQHRLVSTGDGDATVSAEVSGDGLNGPSHFTFSLRDALVSRMTIRQ